MPTRLHLGCGKNYLVGWINCDKLPWLKTNMCFDLEKFPWPFEDNSVDEIFMDNVLEHLDDITATMNEFYRILKPNGVVCAIVPFGNSYWTMADPTHKHTFTEQTMNVYDANHRHYIQGAFDIKTKLNSDWNSLAHAIRNLIPFRYFLRYFIWTMYDTVTYKMIKIQ